MAGKTGCARIWCVVSLLSLFSACGEANAGPQNGPAPALPVEPVIQAGHTAPVEAFGFSGDGRLLATSGADWTVKVWQVATGRLLLSRPVDGSWHIQVAISPDGKTLAAFLRFGKASLFDIASGRLLRVLEHGSEPAAVLFSPDNRMLALGGFDGAVSLWECSTGKRLQKVRTHVEHVGVLGFSRDSSRIATSAGEHAFRSNTVEVWDVKTGRLNSSLEPGAEATSLAFSPDGRTLAVGFGNWGGQPRPTIGLWDTSTLKRGKAFAGHNFEIVSMAFSADGRTLVSSDKQGIARVWDVAAGKAVRSMGSEDFVVPTAVSPNTRWAAARGPVDSAWIYDTSTGVVVRKLSGRSRTISAIAMHPDGHTLLAAGAFRYAVAGRGNGSTAELGEVIVWDLRTGTVRGVLHGLPEGARSLSVALRGARVAAHAGDRAVVWDFPSGRLCANIKSGADSLVGAVLSPDGSTIAMYGSRKMTAKEKADQPPSSEQRPGPPDNTVAVLELWDSTAGRKVRSIQVSGPYVSAAALSPDGRQLFVSSEQVCQIAVGTGLVSRTFTSPKEWPRGAVYALRVSSDGRVLSGAGDGDTLGVWTLDSASTHPRFVRTEQYNTFSIDLNPDGSEVAIAGGPGSVPLRKTGSGAPLAVLTGGAGSIQWVTYSQDGRKVAALDADQRIRIWDRKTTRLLATMAVLPGQGGPTEDLSHPRWLTYSPTGDYDGSPGAENDILWRAPVSLMTGQAAKSRRNPNAIERSLTGEVRPGTREAVRREAAAFAVTATPAQPLRTEQHSSPAKAENKPLKAADARLKTALSKPRAYGDAAVTAGLTAEITKALDEGADPNTTGVNGRTVLMFFARTGNETGLQDLLRQGLDVNKVDVYGNTALLHAADAGNDRIIDLLLANGAVLKGHEGQPNLPLHGDAETLGRALWAALTWNHSQDHFDLYNGLGAAYLLLKAGADANIRDEEGRTPLLVIAGMASDVSNPTLKLLLARGAEVQVEDKQGHTVLDSVTNRDDIALARFFLERGVSPNGGSKGWPPLVMAAHQGKKALVELLLQHGADPNLGVREPNDGRTALGEAIAEGHLDVARLLLDHGAKIDLTDAYDHWTALTYAVMRQDRTAVQLLLERGANVHVKTKAGKSLLQVLHEHDPKDSFGIGPLLRKAGLKE